MMRTITVTLTGGPHLAEFLSFSIKALQQFDPSKPGRRCLRGTRGLTVPPMHVPTSYPVPANAAAVYVYGKSSAGPAEDVHTVLVPEPGAQAVLPLTVASAEKQGEVDRVAQLLHDAPWTFAKVDAVRSNNPHFYTRREDWPQEEEFNFAVRASRRYGHREPYYPPGSTEVAYWETTFHSGSRFVWSFWQAPELVGWINSKPLAVPVVATVVDQQLVAVDARQLDIPPLPLDFAGLEPSITQCPFFQAGVALFGWPVPDKRPRLRTRNGGGR